MSTSSRPEKVWSRERSRRVAMHIGRLLRSARGERGMSQCAVADAAGLHRPVYARLETGTRQHVPTIETLWRACQVLGIGLAELAVELEAVSCHESVDREHVKPARPVQQWDCETSHAWVRRDDGWVCKRCDLVEGVANA